MRCFTPIAGCLNPAEPSLAPLCPSAGMMPPRLYQETLAVRSLRQAVDRGDLPKSLIPKSRASLSGIIARISGQKREHCDAPEPSKRQAVGASSFTDRFVDLKTILHDVLVPHDTVVNKLFVDGRLRQLAVCSVSATSIRERYTTKGQHAFAIDAAPSIIWGVLQGIREYMITTVCPTWLTAAELMSTLQPPLTNKSEVYHVIASPALDNPFIEHVQQALGVRAYYIVHRARLHKTLEGEAKQTPTPDAEALRARKSDRSSALTSEDLEVLYGKTDNALARRQLQLAYLNAKYCRKQKAATMHSEESSEESTTPLPASLGIPATARANDAALHDEHTSFLDNVAPAKPLLGEGAPGGGMGNGDSDSRVLVDLTRSEEETKPQPPQQALSSLLPDNTLEKIRIPSVGGVGEPVWVFNSAYLEELQGLLRSFRDEYMKQRKQLYVTKASQRVRGGPSKARSSQPAPEEASSKKKDHPPSSASPAASKPLQPDEFMVVGVSLSPANLASLPLIRIFKSFVSPLQGIHFHDLFCYLGLQPLSLQGLSIPTDFVVRVNLREGFVVDNEDSEVDVTGVVDQEQLGNEETPSTFLTWPGICLLFRHVAATQQPLIVRVRRVQQMLKSILSIHD